jgi:hypothetical protein
MIVSVDIRHSCGQLRYEDRRILSIAPADARGLYRRQSTGQLGDLVLHFMRLDHLHLAAKRTDLLPNKTPS